MNESLNTELRGAPMAAKKLLFMYLFNQISQAKFTSNFEDRKYAKELLDLARASGYVLKNCKLFAYHYYKNGWARPADFGVDMRDAAMLKRLDLKIKSTVPALTVAGYDRMVEGMLLSKHMVSHVNKLIYKKMIFLTSQSYGYTVGELRSVLLHKAIYALMKQYPLFSSPLHFQNVAKTTIHNTAMTFITAQTRQKRQSMIQNADGTWSSLKAPLESCMEMAAPSVDQHTKDMLASLVKISSKFSTNVQRFLLCMGGVHDPQFSEYLGMDNSTAVDSMRYDQYRSKLEAHLGVTSAQTEALFSHVRNQLS